MSQETTTTDTERVGTEQLITEMQRRLRLARAEGDKLKIDLAEAALNDLLDRY